VEEPVLGLRHSPSAPTTTRRRLGGLENSLVTRACVLPRLPLGTRRRHLERRPADTVVLLLHVGIARGRLLARINARLRPQRQRGQHLCARVRSPLLERQASLWRGWRIHHSGGSVERGRHPERSGEARNHKPAAYGDVEDLPLSPVPPPAFLAFVGPYAPPSYRVMSPKEPRTTGSAEQPVEARSTWRSSPAENESPPQSVLMGPGAVAHGMATEHTTTPSAATSTV
jgi:hypothetical protein